MRQILLRFDRLEKGRFRDRLITSVKQVIAPKREIATLLLTLPLTSILLIVGFMLGELRRPTCSKLKE
jgi:hypothetical protein